MRSLKRAARAEWRGAHVTIPPASSTEKRGSGGSAATTWNIAPSFSRSFSAKRGSARTWGLRSTPTTSTSEFGWVGRQRAPKRCRNTSSNVPWRNFALYGDIASWETKSIVCTWAPLCSIRVQFSMTKIPLTQNPHLHVLHSALQTNSPYLLLSTALVDSTEVEGEAA